MIFTCAADTEEVAVNLGSLSGDANASSRVSGSCEDRCKREVERGVERVTETGRGGVDGIGERGGDAKGVKNDVCRDDETPQ